MKSAIRFSIDVDPMEEREEEREDEVEMFFVLRLEVSIAVVSVASSSSSNLTQLPCSIILRVEYVSCFTAPVELRWEGGSSQCLE